MKVPVVILVDNAVKYTPSGGELRVSLSEEDGYALLRVTDTGAGIPEQALPHVFERFYRADTGQSRDPGGTGLGLAITKWIVGQHGGEIGIDSKPGHGTTVRVRLPLCDRLAVDQIGRAPRRTAQRWRPESQA